MRRCPQILAAILAAAGLLASGTAPAGGPQADAALTPGPAGVSELGFHDFFRLPVGSRGLEPTDKLRALHGRIVRVLGYQVEQDTVTPGRLLVTGQPAQLHEREYGQADDLPAATLFVMLSDEPDRVLPHHDGPLLLTGRLDVGPQEEPDGRRSLVRLHVNAPKQEEIPDGNARRQ